MGGGKRVELKMKGRGGSKGGEKRTKLKKGEGEGRRDGSRAEDKGGGEVQSPPSFPFSSPSPSWGVCTYKSCEKCFLQLYIAHSILY